MAAQSDDFLSKFSLESDFRFRIEQDWDSRKTDGTYRDDRTRLRYRLRAGATFKNDWYTMGFRLRTGQPNKQQDPQLTLGTASKEFGTLPIGLEKLYFQGAFDGLKFWLGKNAFSFDKNNELFWSDNVFPEGVFLEHTFDLDLQTIEKISVRGSHYIIASSGQSLGDDAYFQGIQSTIHFANQWFKLFPTLYVMRNIPNIPDGYASFNMDYSIFHIGSKIQASRSGDLLIDLDVYQNLEDYTQASEMPDGFEDQKTGYSVGLQYGRLKDARDWKLKVTYTAMEKYAALDYMAQNDWARWDYSAFNSPDGRLTNFEGVEVVVGYSISEKVNLVAKYYNVNQIVPTGAFAESGQRVRLDLNVKM